MCSYSKALKFLLFLCFLFTSVLFQAQENCTNAIDDDGDGFIDLNDSDCECVENENLIPNGDFEQYEELPSGPEQIHLATHWINPTNSYDIHYARASYHHWDAFTQIPAYPYPSGKGVVSTQSKITSLANGGDQTYLDFYKDFFGINLDQALTPDNTYIFSFFIYRLNHNENFDWPQLEIGLYGKNGNLRSFELDYARYPDYHEDWSELTRVPFYPKHEWQKLSIEFSVDENVSAIVIGLASGIPYTYYEAFGTKILAYDNVSIQKKSEDFILEASGAACSENLRLSAVSLGDFNPTSYQWYQDGVAMVGQTQASLNITEDMPEAYYSVRAMSSTGCRNSQAFPYILSDIEFKYKIEVNDQAGSVRLYDIWNQSDYTYSIDNINYQAQPVFNNVDVGEGVIYVKNHLNCIVKEIPYAIFKIYNVITPNNDGMNDTWYIVGLQHYPNTKVSIYDQLGVQRYSYTIPQISDEFAWDGTNKGRPLASGEYWYLIEVNDGRTIKGSLTIKRN